MEVGRPHGLPATLRAGALQEGRETTRDRATGRNASGLAARRRAARVAGASSEERGGRARRSRAAAGLPLSSAADKLGPWLDARYASAGAALLVHVWPTGWKR